jgi:N-acetylmuramoyl-L-alanine amidase
VTWVGSPNHYTNDLHNVVALVVHTMEGTLKGTDGWFNNPDNDDSSAHYGVGLQGQAHQYVALENGAWGNGRLEPGNHWAPKFGTENPNHRSISIETEDNGSGATAVTDEQYAGVLGVARIALARWPSITTVTVHRAISPQTRPECAGDRWWSSGRIQELAQDLGLGLLL